MLSLSFETIIGLLFGFGLFFYAIFSSTDNYVVFISMSSFIMVFGGTMAATMISYQGRYVLSSLKTLLSILAPAYVNRKTLIEEAKKIIEWDALISRDGMVAFETEVQSNDNMDPFLKYGADLLSTGYKEKELSEMLTNAVESFFERGMVQAEILRNMANIAPAFGMIGTLVGLVIMLDTMGGDITKIGPGMALAILTTLYGVMLSQLLFKPAAEKYQQRQEIFRFRNHLIAEGFIMIAAGSNPLKIQDKMNSYLDPSIHFNVINKDSAAAAPEESAS
jgi:chemotaxis protein MotA